MLKRFVTNACPGSLCGFERDEKVAWKFSDGLEIVRATPQSTNIDPDSRSLELSDSDLPQILRNPRREQILRDRKLRVTQLLFRVSTSSFPVHALPRGYHPSRTCTNPSMLFLKRPYR